MSTTTPRRRRDGGDPSGQRAVDAGPARTAAVAVAVAAAVLVVLAVAVWVTTAELGAGPAPGPDQLAVPGGLVQVEEVVEAEQAMAGMAMPGMGTDSDPVAAGERRVSVDLTVLATGRDAVTVDPDDFRLAVAGEEARPPHRAFLPATTVPGGSRLSGTLVFDVTADAAAGALGHVGGGTVEVALPSGAPVPSPPHASRDVEHGGGSVDDPAELP